MPQRTRPEDLCMVASASTIGEERYVTAGGQRIRVNVRQGTGVPLVLCNGIGASLEVLDPLVEQLDPEPRWSDSTFPGPEDRPHPLPPTGFPTLPGCWAGCCPSWESAWWTCSGCPGAAALRSSSPSRIRADAGAWCWWRRAPACLWCPPTRGCWRKCLPRAGSRIPTTPHPLPPSCTAAPSALTARTLRDCSCGSCTPDRRSATCTSCSAGSVWTSLFALPAVRQETLIVAGTDDPIIPVVNAHIMNALLPHSRLHLHPGGHIDLVHNAAELAPVIEKFLSEPGERP